MKFTVCHVIFLVESQVVVPSHMCLLDKDLEHRKRLMLERIVHFSTILKTTLAHHIIILKHTRNIIILQSSYQICKNRLSLKTSVDTIRWLTVQACTIRDHDETLESKNRGNFLEIFKLLASYNDKVAQVVLENASYNLKYTSHQIQKEIAYFSRKLRSYIGEELKILHFHNC
ncbi:hypothetical protein CR513_12246, partial [Mucuna pruriens]